MNLSTSQAFDALNAEQIAAIVNGCGPASSKFKFDKLLGVNLFWACGIHDVDYGHGGSELDRVEADKRFIVNILIIILNNKGWSQWYRIPLCFPYYIIVRISGRRHFCYTEGNKRPHLSDLRAAWVPVALAGLVVLWLAVKWLF